MLQSVRERVLNLAQNRIAAAIRVKQLAAQVGFERFQQVRVGLGIETLRARPVTGEAQLGSSSLRQQHDAHVDELVLHRVRHEAEKEETAFLLLDHGCTTDLLSMSGSGR